MSITEFAILYLVPASIALTGLTLTYYYRQEVADDPEFHFDLLVCFSLIPIINWIICTLVVTAALVLLLVEATLYLNKGLNKWKQ